MMRKWILVVWALVTLMTNAVAMAQTRTVEIHADRPGHAVSPMLYGLMTEEINHSYDGGLYAEMIRNRTFQDDAKKAAGWELIGTAGKDAMELDRTDPVSAALPVSLKISMRDGSATNRVGVANVGYWGMGVRPETVYRASFYAESGDKLDGGLTVDLESVDGGTVFASANIPAIADHWQRYACELKTGKMDGTARARLVICGKSPGTIRLNLVSLFPPTFDDRANGNRPDLMEMLAAMKPAFLRFPGGNYLEGDRIADRFEWKKTIGPLEDRPGHQGPWGYRSSDGMGMLEFLEWCEDLHMEPVLGVYAGYSLRHQYVEAGAKLEPFVQDALDEIEYCNGDGSTTWGARRVKDGHAKPFDVRYVEVGNEDWFDKSGSYQGRFEQFFKAIKGKYPEMQVIATTRVRGIRPDVVDEHFYRKAAAMAADAEHYDRYDRNGPKIFVGEWASTEGRPTPNMNAALGDAAWLTGLERNSDVVVMGCYAPLLVNMNAEAAQWGTNLIGYDAENCFGSPSYYAQCMFAGNVGDRTVPVEISAGGGKRETLFVSCTRDGDGGDVIVKVVNFSGVEQAVEFKVDGVKGLAGEARETVLSGKIGDQNSLAEPRKVAPRDFSVEGVGGDFTVTFEADSVSVFRMKTGGG